MIYFFQPVEDPEGWKVVFSKKAPYHNVTWDANQIDANLYFEIMETFHEIFVSSLFSNINIFTTNIPSVAAIVLVTPAVFVDSLNFRLFLVVSFQAAVELEIIQQARMTLAKSPPGTTVGGW